MIVPRVSRFFLALLLALVIIIAASLYTILKFFGVSLEQSYRVALLCAPSMETASNQNTISYISCGGFLE